MRFAPWALNPPAKALNVLVVALTENASPPHDSADRVEVRRVGIRLGYASRKVDSYRRLAYGLLVDAIGRTQLEAALAALGELLAARRLHYELVIVGGGNLILRDLISRPTTKDLDVLGGWTRDGVVPMRPVPGPLRDAIVDVGRALGLGSDWLNPGPDALLDLGLPPGFNERLERRDFGGLVVWLAGWYDMVCFKLYAAVDQGPRSRHFQDLLDLRPARNDFLEAARWAMTHDPSPGFRSLLVGTLEDLAVEDADASLG